MQGLKVEVFGLPARAMTEDRNHTNERTMRKRETTVLILATLLAGVAVIRSQHTDPRATGITSTRLGPVPTRILVAATAMSRDGRHVAFVASRGDKMLVVVDGQPGPEYDSISAAPPVFSLDSKRVAYVAGKGQKQLVVVDDEPGPEYDGISAAPPVFSPDSKRVAYVAVKGQKWMVVVDDQPGPEYEGLTDI
jgi:hypothetical protein